MPSSDRVPEAITAEMLTTLLRGSGALPRGAVSAVERRANAAFNSRIDHLQLTYSPDSPSDLPTRLVLKRNLAADWAVLAGAREVSFYRHVAALAGDHLPMVLRPLAATHDPKTGRSLLLLPDLSATHREPTERARVLALDGVPTDAELDSIVDTLAAFHAYWWQHPALGSAPAPLNSSLATSEDFRRYAARISADSSAFSAIADADLSPAERACCEDALARLPRLWDQFLAGRLSRRRQITLCHSDCYFAAFLCPRYGTVGRVMMIDWQGPEAGIGTRDLVYMFATFWTPEQRRDGDRERRLLRRYHAGLRAHGVTNYTWDDLTRDYRLMLALLLFLPIWDAVNGSSRAYWRPKYSCLSAAYQDWQCKELVD